MKPKEGIIPKISRQQILADIRDYMNDGATPFDHWGALHTVESLFHSKHITQKDVVSIIQEARKKFGECENSPVYAELKSRFPEAFS